MLKKILMWRNEETLIVINTINNLKIAWCWKHLKIYLTGYTVEVTTYKSNIYFTIQEGQSLIISDD